MLRSDWLSYCEAICYSPLVAKAEYKPYKDVPPAPYWSENGYRLQLFAHFGLKSKLGMVFEGPTAYECVCRFSSK